MTNKKQRGQFFTVNDTVLDNIMSLIEEPAGYTLEPSAGAGNIMKSFLQKFPNSKVEGWELDTNITPIDKNLNIVFDDFFVLAEKEHRKFRTIIGNPPFVAWKNVEENTKASACLAKIGYSDKTNLYHLFIDKCIDLLEDDGQLIFIVPKEWMYSTSALPLRKKMLELGTITHIIDGGEEKVFPDADVPALIIFRYVKTPSQKHEIAVRSGFNKDVSDLTTRYLKVSQKGLWMISATEEDILYKVEDIFDVKVGIVTGADKTFNVNNHPDLAKFEKEKTVTTYLTTKGHEKFIDVTNIVEEKDIPENTHKYLLEHRDILINRGIAKFNEKNWWKYGAVRNKALMESDRKRIYVLAKTRNSVPFFTDNNVKYFSGGILCLFLKENVHLSIEDALKLFNSKGFMCLCKDFGITTGNKVSFQPSTLGEIPFIYIGEIKFD